MWLAKTSKCRSKLFYPTCLLILFLFSPSMVRAFMSDKDIAIIQKEIAGKPVGGRIAFWAEKFVGTPYDPDPLGEYVTKKNIVADERIDCMYLSFRAVELALSLTPEDAIRIALDKRFINKGRLSDKGDVLNYEDRFQYGEDMIDSGKWGKEITEKLGKVTEIAGSRGRGKVKIISKETLLKSVKVSERQSIKVSEDRSHSDTMTLGRYDAFKDGDFIFFIKAVEKRKVEEIVGHIGVIKTEYRTQNPKSGIKSKERKEIYLIHAAGVKNKGGEVKKVRFYDYASSMPFAGIRVGRFD